VCAAVEVNRPVAAFTIDGPSCGKPVDDWWVSCGRMDSVIFFRPRRSEIVSKRAWRALSRSASL